MFFTRDILYCDHLVVWQNSFLPGPSVFVFDWQAIPADMVLGGFGSARNLVVYINSSLYIFYFQISIMQAWKVKNDSISCFCERNIISFFILSMQVIGGAIYIHTALLHTIRGACHGTFRHSFVLFFGFEIKQKQLAKIVSGLTGTGVSFFEQDWCEWRLMLRSKPIRSQPLWPLRKPFEGSNVNSE